MDVPGAQTLRGIH